MLRNIVFQVGHKIHHHRIILCHIHLKPDKVLYRAQGRVVFLQNFAVVVHTVKAHRKMYSAFVSHGICCHHPDKGDGLLCHGLFRYGKIVSVALRVFVVYPNRKIGKVTASIVAIDAQTDAVHILIPFYTKHNALFRHRDQSLALIDHKIQPSIRFGHSVKKFIQIVHITPARSKLHL